MNACPESRQSWLKGNYWYVYPATPVPFGCIADYVYMVHIDVQPA